MTLKDRGVCNVANVCWQRVPDRRTSHWKRPFTELGDSRWNCIWWCVRIIEERSRCRRDDAAVVWTMSLM